MAKNTTDERPYVPMMVERELRDFIKNEADKDGVILQNYTTDLLKLALRVKRIQFVPVAGTVNA